MMNGGCFPFIILSYNKNLSVQLVPLIVKPERLFVCVILKQNTIV